VAIFGIVKLEGFFESRFPVEVRIARCAVNKAIPAMHLTTIDPAKCSLKYEPQPPPTPPCQGESRVCSSPDKGRLGGVGVSVLLSSNIIWPDQ
jgi:hypothetical protein